MSPLAVSPDGQACSSGTKWAKTAFRGPLWEVPVLGGSARKLGETAKQAAWSRDGRMIDYSDDKDLFTAKSDGAESHKLISLPDLVYDLAWSPDGTVIRFRLGGFATTQGSLWQVSVDENYLRQRVSEF
jgi:hypothetical protein